MIFIFFYILIYPLSTKSHIQKSLDILSIQKEELNEIEKAQFIEKIKQGDQNGVSRMLRQDSRYLLIEEEVSGNSPLQIAILNQQMNIASLIVFRSQVNYEHQNKKGQTALMMAIKEGRNKHSNYLSLACQFIERGAEIYTIDNQGRNVLNYIHLYLRGEGPLRSYIKSIIDDHVRSIDKLSSMILNREQEGVKQYFQERPQDINRQNIDMRTPLQQAVNLGNNELSVRYYTKIKL